MSHGIVLSWDDESRISLTHMIDLNDHFSDLYALLIGVHEKYHYQRTSKPPKRPTRQTKDVASVILR